VGSEGQAKRSLLASRRFYFPEPAADSVYIRHDTSNLVAVIQKYRRSHATLDDRHAALSASPRSLVGQGLRPSGWDSQLPRTTTAFISIMADCLGWPIPSLWTESSADDDVGVSCPASAIALLADSATKSMRPECRRTRGSALGPRYQWTTWLSRSLVTSSHTTMIYHTASPR
jgi:hypothetical protein